MHQASPAARGAGKSKTHPLQVHDAAGEPDAVEPKGSSSMAATSLLRKGTATGALPPGQESATGAEKKAGLARRTHSWCRVGWDWPMWEEVRLRGRGWG